MKPKLYTPSPVLLPVDIANTSLVREKLISYTRGFILRAYKDSNIKGKSHRTMVVNSKDSPKRQKAILRLLQHPVPLYHDVLIVHNKLFLTGSHFPGLYEIIGKPLLFVREKSSDRKLQVRYFQDFPTPKIKNYFNASYLTIYDLPSNLIENPTKWELIFQFKDFEQCINLQNNPFSNAKCKTTLNTLQKDNLTEWISEWCNYYFYRHGVERVIIYNNGPLSPKTLPDLEVNEKIELWYVEWDHPKQQYFARCQTGALTHSYYWVGKKADYFLNFDIDEYLVNDSREPLIKYMQRTSPNGISVSGYLTPEDSTPPDPQKDTLGLKELSKEQYWAYKYVYKGDYWHHLQIHSAVKSLFFPKLRFWLLLQPSNSSIRFIIYRFIYSLMKKLFLTHIKIGIKHSRELYFLHYRGTRNNQWKAKDHIYCENQ